MSFRWSPDRIDATVALIAKEYSQSTAPWILGFSGGKDSSAVLRMLYAALLRVPSRATDVTVLYCDTGVEIPVIAQQVKGTLRRLSIEARKDGLPLKVKIARPRIEDSYFVKVIGRGYPPPTNKFRWCTDRLRIAPVQRAISGMSTHGATVLLGVRQGESQERDRTLKEVETERPFFLTQRGNAASLVFAPLLDYSTQEVWDVLFYYQRPKALETDNLFKLYRYSAGECPIIRDPRGSPCAKGRFGCWTCTVIRQDRGVQGLVDGGFAELGPLLEFRNWLQAIRDKPEYRCARRRNGLRGPGPLTLAARQLILRRLRSTERRAGTQLIKRGEIQLIRAHWQADRESPTYRSIEAAGLE